MRQRRREGGEIADRAAQLTRGPFVECDLDTSGDVGDVAGDLARDRGEPRDVGKSRPGKDVAAARGFGNLCLHRFIMWQRRTRCDRRLPLSEQARLVQEHDRRARKLNRPIEIHANVHPSAACKLDGFDRARGGIAPSAHAVLPSIRILPAVAFMRSARYGSALVNVFAA